MLFHKSECFIGVFVVDVFRMKSYHRIEVVGIGAANIEKPRKVGAADGRNEYFLDSCLSGTADDQVEVFAEFRSVDM